MSSCALRWKAHRDSHPTKFHQNLSSVREVQNNQSTSSKQLTPTVAPVVGARVRRTLYGMLENWYPDDVNLYFYARRVCPKKLSLTHAKINPSHWDNLHYPYRNRVSHTLATSILFLVISGGFGENADSLDLGTFSRSLFATSRGKPLVAACG